MLAACAGHHRPEAATAVAVPIAQSDARPGVGKVVQVVDPTGPGPVRSVSTQSLTIKMRDGSIQYVTQIGPQIELGETVRLTPNSIQRMDLVAFGNH